MAAVRKPYQQQITPGEAQRAIYIDFEGFKGKPPSLFGWVWAVGKKASDSNLACIHDIHDKSLRPLIGAIDVESGSVGSYEQRPFSVGQSINDLARRANKQDRLIVSWSTYELNKIAESELSPGLLRLFKLNYRDGKATAKKWFQQLGLSTASQSNQLVRYLDHAGYPMPDTYRLGETTKRLRSVLGGIKTRGSYTKLTAHQQECWRGLLDHNFVDCHGLRQVTKAAAKALD